MFLVYETEFTARKSKVAIFTAEKRRVPLGRGTRHFGDPPRNRCLDKTLAAVTESD